MDRVAPSDPPESMGVLQVALTVRKKRFLGRLAGYATNPARSRLRTALHRDQRHEIGGVPITLPPEHDLPFYQQRDPSYDAYAIALLAALAAGPRPVHVIDVGANVGDTAAAVLASDPATRVTSVEGDERFLAYLRRNLAPHAERARVVAGFVGPVGAQVVYRRQGSTGGFQARELAGEQVQDWVEPAEVLSSVEDDALVVWKSDIDGFDIHVLVEHWPVISSRCEVLWFEYDPPRTLGDRADVERLIEALTADDRTVAVYDNLGRRMTVLAPGATLAPALRALTQWLHEQYDGHITVPYLDIWAVRPAAAALLNLRD